MKKLLKIAAFCAVAAVSTPQAVQAQDAYMGEVILFAGTFCPRGYAEANGALLSIAPNTALFSILGTAYGGNGTTTFGLPDLRGRAPVHHGEVPGSTKNLRIGFKVGSDQAKIEVRNMPAHKHDTEVDLMATQNEADGKKNPAGLFLTEPSRGTIYSARGTKPLVEMDPDSLLVKDHSVGGGQPLSIQNPVLAMMYCINTVGLYPSRN